MDIEKCITDYKLLCSNIDKILIKYPIYICSFCNKISYNGKDYGGKGFCKSIGHQIRNSCCNYKRLETINEIYSYQNIISEVLNNLSYYNK